VPFFYKTSGIIEEERNPLSSAEEERQREDDRDK